MMNCDTLINIWINVTNKIHRTVCRLDDDERGENMLTYALLILLMLMAAAVFLPKFWEQVGGLFEIIGKKIGDMAGE